MLWFPYISAELQYEVQTACSPYHARSGSKRRHRLTGSRNSHCETTLPFNGDLSSVSAKTTGDISALHLTAVSIANRQWLTCQSKPSFWNLLWSSFSKLSLWIDSRTSLRQWSWCITKTRQPSSLQTVRVGAWGLGGGGRQRKDYYPRAWILECPHPADVVDVAIAYDWSCLSGTVCP